MHQFYSYLWLDANDCPRYVGKGWGSRAYKRSHGHQPPEDHDKIFVFPQDCEADAFESERALIWLFGRRDLGTGGLLNKTSGGQGLSGHVFSLVHRQKIAEASSHTQKGRKHSLEHIEKIAIANRGKKRSAGHIAILADWHRNNPQTPEWRAKVEAAKCGRIYSAKALANFSAAQKGHAPTFVNRKHTPESIAKQSAARKAYWVRRRQNAM